MGQEQQGNQSRIFEEWTVECNNCNHYWNDTCDGVSKGSVRPCNSFLATRSVILPSKIEALETAYRRLEVVVCIMAFALCIFGGLVVAPYVVGVIMR